MLEKIHQLLGTTLGRWRKAMRSNRQGQVAIILIILVAVCLIFYAATLNMGRLSQYKIITLKAATLGSSQLASEMASWGEKLFQETLGGKEEICSFTAVLTAFILIIVFIIILIASIITYGAAAGIAAAVGPELFVALIVSLSVGIVSSGASMGIQAGYVNPKITASWNAMMSNLGTTGSFMEQGIQSALMSAVTDSTEIPDIYDADQDGKFGDLRNALDGKSAPDYISRLGYLYTQRLKEADKDVDSAAISDFQAALGRIMFAEDESMANHWGFSDPALSSHPCFPNDPVNAPGYPALCDQCCQPKYVPSYEPNHKHCVSCNDGTDDCPDAENPNTYPWNWSLSEDAVCQQQGGPRRLAPKCCDPGPNQCGNPYTCYKRSPFWNGIDEAVGTPPPDPGDAAQIGNNKPGNYPWVYDYYPVENTTNNLASPPKLSFRELLGVDDEHGFYRVNEALPNWQTAPNFSENQIPLVPAPASDALVFNLEDASNFYIPPVFAGAPAGVPPIPQNPEQKKGVFPFLYKMQDWYVNLMSTQYDFGFTPLSVLSVPPARPEECHWCDYTNPDISNPYRGDCATAPIPPATNPLYLDPSLTATRNLELTLNPLVLPDIPRSLNDGAVFYSGGWCVDRSNRPVGGGTPPQIPDMIGTIPELFADPNLCPMEPLNTGWRRGSEKYCAAPEYDPDGVARFPYAEGCAESKGYHICTETLGAPRDCECGEPEVQDVKSLFTNDHLDEIVYGIPEFVKYGSALSAIPASMLATSIPDWYNEAAEWIEPPCDCVKDENGQCQGGDPACQKPLPGISGPITAWSCCPGSYSKLDRPGRLYVWRKTLRDFKIPLGEWLNGTGTPPRNSLTDGAWCVPATPAEQAIAAGWDAVNVPPQHRAEAATFDVNSNGVQGDVSDVIACLRWNSEDIVYNQNPATWVDCSTVPPPLAPYENLAMCKDSLGPGKENSCAANCTTAKTGLPFNPPVLPPPGALNDCSIGGAFDQALNAAMLAIPIPVAQAGLNCAAGTCCAPKIAMQPGLGPQTQEIKGNALKFLACSMFIGGGGTTRFYWEACRDLPRTLLPPPAQTVRANITADINRLETLLRCDWALPGGPGCDALCNQALLSDPTIGPVDCTSLPLTYSPLQLPVLPADTFGKRLRQAEFTLWSSMIMNPAYDTFVLDSWQAARNQVAKFKHRGNFLEARRAEAQQFWQILEDADSNISQFIDNDSIFGTAAPPPSSLTQDSPSEQLIEFRQKWAVATGLPSVAVYVWKDPPLPLKKPRVDAQGLTTWQGLAHAVKVEARIPRRCNDACATNEWPEVRTKNPNIFRRCFYLANKQGMVKVRVIRWDESSSSGSPMVFPGGRPLWTPRFFHPDAIEGSAGDIWAKCEVAYPKIWRHDTPPPNYHAWAVPTGSPDSDINFKYFGDAFMLNRPPLPPPVPPETEDPTEPDYRECWNLVHSDMLRNGVVSESCAWYYFSDGDANFGVKGFKIKFVPCDKEFLQGNN